MKTLRMAVMLVLLTFAAQAVFAQSESNCKIKGFLAKDGKKLYLVPGHKLYDKIQINTEGGEQWFCTAQEAESAGFMFVPDPQNPQLRPAAAAAPAPPTAPVTTQKPQQPTEQAAPAEATPEPQPTEQVVTEQQSPAETPQEQQPTEAPAQTTPESQPVDIPTTETSQEMPPIPLESLSMLMVPIMIFTGIVALIFIIAFWKIFTKAGQPGWVSLIPIYNTWVMFKIAGLPALAFLGLFVPLVNVVVLFLFAIKLAQSFGKGAGYGLGLFFLPFIFYPMLAFGSAEYNG